MMYNFNALWSSLKRQTIGKAIQREQDLPLAMDLVKAFRVLPKEFRVKVARELLQDEQLLVGADAGYGGESKRWLEPDVQTAIATTGANTTNYNILDYFIVDTIGFMWTVAGTVTALVMDFDLHDQLAGGNLLTDKLDATNGVITAPTVAGQSIGARLAKDLNSTGPIRVAPGNSIQAIVTTTTTAGNGLPFVLGFPISESLLNDTNYVASS